MYEMHFGVPMSGAVLNTINIRLDAHMLAILLEHSGSKLVFVDPTSLPLLRDTLWVLPPGHPAPRVILIEDAHEEFPQVEADPSVLTYESLLEKGDPEFTWVRPASEWDPIVLNYTSGTTSAPKGVVHCHRGIFLMTMNSIVEWAVPPRVRYLWTLPMFHGNGWSYTWGMAVVGGTNVCIRRFDAAVIYDSIARHGVTHFCAASVVLNMLATAPEVVRRPLPGKVHIKTAAASPPPAVLGRMEALGFDISHCYGLTEVAGTVVSCTWNPEWDKLPLAERAWLKARQGVRTAGMAEVDILDKDTGRSVPHDGSTMGEIVLRGAVVMLGYLNNDEATKEVVRDDGWFFTGDVGVMHPDGYLQIRDRSKDVIISGGENISSVEVESVLYMHPAVNEVAVVARPDEFWGETPCAFVVLKEGAAASTVTGADVIAWCRDRMPHYMVPKTVVFRAELPRTSTGKAQKYLLRDLAKDAGITGNKSTSMV
jgi:acyl-CoA synthetase (AMP-forming)/AMP-acid ligase II